MKKNRIRLEELKVKSFITSQNSFDPDTIKGGRKAVPLLDTKTQCQPENTEMCAPSPKDLLK